MKPFSKIAAIALFILPVATAFCTGQEGGWMTTDEGKKEWKQMAEKRHQKRLEKLTKELGLSKEQADKVSEITKSGWEKISAERQKMRETARSIREEIDKQVETVLKSEQVEKFKNVREKMKKKFKERAKKHFGKRYERGECPPEAPPK